MSGRLAGGLLVAVSLLLAVLLLTGAIGPSASGLAFALALVALGLASGGFRRR